MRPSCILNTHRLWPRLRAAGNSAFISMKRGFTCFKKRIRATKLL